MCGIVGMMSLNSVGFTQIEVTAFEQMLFADQLRGVHGTGIFFDKRNGDVDYIRGAMDGSAFLKDHEVQKSLTRAYQQSSFLVGHNRWATKGAHTNENTHPFHEGNITLVHNGTLFNHRKLKNVEVDSHAICHSIAEKGEEETLKEIDGAFALVWYDQDTKQLNFIRNSQRPLNIIRTKNLIVISSEAKLAEWILDRNKESVITVEPCEVGMLYTFDRATREITSTKMELRVWKKPEYSGNYYGEANSSGYWKGNTWVPFRKTNDDLKEIDKKINDIFEDRKYLPSTSSQTSNVTYIARHRTNDLVNFTPLSIDAKGNGYQLTLIVQGALSDPSVYAIFYHADKAWLDTLMMFHTIKATILQVRQKDGVISYVIKDPVTVGEKEVVEEYEDDIISTAFDDTAIPDLIGAIH